MRLFFTLLLYTHVFSGCILLTPRDPEVDTLLEWLEFFVAGMAHLLGIGGLFALITVGLFWLVRVLIRRIRARRG